MRKDTIKSASELKIRNEMYKGIQPKLCLMYEITHIQKCYNIALKGELACEGCLREFSAKGNPKWSGGRGSMPEKERERIRSLKRDHKAY